MGRCCGFSKCRQGACLRACRHIVFGLAVSESRRTHAGPVIAAAFEEVPVFHGYFKACL